MNKKQKRRLLKSSARHIRKMQAKAKAEKEAKENPEPKIIPDHRDNSMRFGEKTPETAKAIAEWDEKKEHIKAHKLHEEFKAELFKEGRHGDEVLEMLKAFKNRLKNEIESKVVRDDALLMVDQMKQRLIAMLIIPDDGANPEKN